MRSNPPRSARRLSWLALALLASTLLAACAKLPPQRDAEFKTALPPATDSTLGQLAAAAPDPSLSGIYPLADPMQAFVARMQLIRSAERAIDIQYYIWHADVVGIYLLEELWQAAERGVRLRLLLDDNGIHGMDNLLLTLDAHPQIEVRLFNPFAHRRFKWLDFATDFMRVNRRMHNKSLTVDGVATLVGGRNIGNEYFGAEAHTLFADLDVVALGSAAKDVTQAYDRYWNAEATRAVGDVLSAHRLDRETLQAIFNANRKLPAARRYEEAIRTRIAEEPEFVRQQNPAWAPALLLIDEPVKARGKAERQQLMLEQLISHTGDVQQSLDIVSPYFVPGDAGVHALAELARRGVKVRVLTNSLAATDVAAVHSGYARHRKNLLEAGIRLYELRPDGDPKERRKQAKAAGNRTAFSSSAASLHAKTFAIDGQRVFVGSFNFDLRSFFLNTEMGLLISEPGLAGAVATTLDARLPDLAWEVKLDEHGHLRWHGENEEGLPQILEREPESSLWRRAGVRVLSWLPIEWLL